MRTQSLVTKKYETTDRWLCHPLLHNCLRLDHKRHLVDAIDLGNPIRKFELALPLNNETALAPPASDAISDLYNLLTHLDQAESQPPRSALMYVLSLSAAQTQLAPPSEASEQPIQVKTY